MTRGGMSKRSYPGRTKSQAKRSKTFEQCQDPPPVYSHANITDVQGSTSASATQTDSGIAASSMANPNRPNRSVQSPLRTQSNQNPMTPDLETMGSDSSTQPTDTAAQEINSLGENGENGTLGSRTKRTRGGAIPGKPVAPGSKKPIARVMYGKLVGGSKVTGFLRPNIRTMYKEPWKHYHEVLENTKERLWNKFLSEFEVEGELALACKYFHKQNQDHFRSWLSYEKRKAKSRQEKTGVASLCDTKLPYWCTSEDIWMKLTQYWETPEQKAISEINTKNRFGEGNREEGDYAKHGMGRKSLIERCAEKTIETGIEAFPMEILAEVNQVKDRTTGAPTGEVYDKALQSCLEEYPILFQEMHNTQEQPKVLDIGVWKNTAGAKPGLRKGRLLGIGSLSQAVFMTPEVGYPNRHVDPVVQEQINALQASRDAEEAEKLRLTGVVTELQTELHDVKGELGSFKEKMAMFESFMMSNGFVPPTPASQMS